MQRRRDIEIAKGENMWRRKIFFVEEKKNGEGQGGTYLEKGSIFCGGEEKGNFD